MKATLHTLLVFLTCAFALAAEPSRDEAMEHFKQGAFDIQTLIEVLPQMADPAKRNAIRGVLSSAEQPPRGELVSLLGHPTLAVRLGALEVLEEFAGGDLSFNPWAPADSPENSAALARWNAWAKNPSSSAADGSIFSGDQRRAYLGDILGNDADKSARARRMLEAEGMAAIGYLETFIGETPTLDAGHRARIREAQYQITLSKQLADQAAITARHLAFGSRDQILAALSTVRGAGLLALPILRDFISHPDPLVRETAIDALLVTGGEPAVSIVAPLLSREDDVNVIHGAIRRLKDVPGDGSRNLVASFLTHPDEDLLISAIQASLSLASNDEGNRSSGTNRPADPAVIKALDDARWRVRATALEYIAMRRIPAAKDRCFALLEDPDDFVRFAAIKALTALNATDVLPKLKSMFLANEAMAGPVLEGYGILERKPDEEILAKLDASSPETRLTALRAAETHSTLSMLPLRYAGDADLDVACAALRGIARDSENSNKSAEASAILRALRSGLTEKVDAVLGPLVLPKSKFRSSPMPVESFGNRESTSLDPLYDAFLQTGKATPAATGEAVLPDAPQGLTRELILRTSAETPPPMRFRAALVLATAGYPEGFAALTRDIPSLTTAQKTAIGNGIDEPSSREALPLFTALLRDPLPEVRTSAASAVLSNDSSPAFLALVMNELIRPGSPLQAHEVYSYRFESATKSKPSASFLRGWCLGALEAAETPKPVKVLAVLALRHLSPSVALPALEKYRTSGDPLLRRAAWHATLKLRPAMIAPSAERISGDPEAFVRIVLPQLLQTDASRNWSHHFSDVHLVQDASWSYNEAKPRLTEDIKTRLATMAAQDPSEAVRFESSFTLLVSGSPIDVAAFAALVPPLPKDLRARERVTYWLSENAERAKPGLAPLLGIIDPSKILPAKMKVLNERINPSRGDGFATFSALAKSAPASGGKDDSLLAEETGAGEEPARTSLKVVYFYKPGCPECTRAKQYLDAIRPDFPLLEIESINILESSGTIRNQALCGRFSVPSAKHTLSPAIFTQGGYSIREDISPRTLAALFAKTMALPQDDAWMEFGEAEELAAVQTVDNRYAAFTLPVVIGAGLLDGINPCAFATIIFFLSYLQIARRTPREMLMVGAAFISAVFIAYLAAGLVLYQTLAVLNERFAGIQKWMNVGFAVLALLAAFLSFRDAWKARGGRMTEMTLQLPGFLKDRIRGVIRSGAKARNFVVAAFVSGLLISLLELACTGQVYAPIIYQIQQGRLDAVVWLVIYNLAFITPLVIIFLLAYGGMRSEKLVEFQKNHTAAVKIGLGLLFLVLALMIVAGQKLLGQG